MAWDLDQVLGKFVAEVRVDVAIVAGRLSTIETLELTKRMEGGWQMWFARGATLAAREERSSLR